MFGDCHFAIDAINALTSKSEFPAIMKKIGIVLADAGNNDFANINILRKAHPEFELHPVHKQGLWGQKGFNIFDSPNLVFLSDGVAKFSFVGSGPEVIKNFCSGLKSIGIAAPESCPN